MILRHAALATLTVAACVLASESCSGHACFEKLLDTSSMLIMRTDIEVADDAAVESSSKDSIGALQDSEFADDATMERSKENVSERQVQSDPHNISLIGVTDTLEEFADEQTVMEADSLQSPLQASVLDPSGSELVFVEVRHEENSSESGAASSASVAQASEIAERNRTRTASSAAVLHTAVQFHEVSEGDHLYELSIPEAVNATETGLKHNAEQVLLFTILEVLFGLVFVAAVLGCFCFCTVRQAQAEARATAHTADIRKARETGRFTTRATSRATTFSKRCSKDDCDEHDEDEEWEDDAETQDTDSENVTDMIDHDNSANTDGKTNHVRFGKTEAKFIEE
jgi:hypothetical protein